MADEADRAQAYEERERQAAIAWAAKPLAKGEPGDCIDCGAPFGRLVCGLCVACREDRDSYAKL